jgi:hypothetical protein
MNMKNLILPLLFVLPFSVQAQDKIYKRDGSVIESKVKTVSASKITYKRFDNQEGPDYTSPMREVAKIVYQNGVTDNFEEKTLPHRAGNRSNKKPDGGHKLGNNLFTFIPGAYTAALTGTINDPGIGLCYERLLDDEGHFGFVVPLLYSFAQNKNYNNYYYMSSYAYTGTNNYTSLTFAPGIKFYPDRGVRRARYAIGASFFVTRGTEPYDVYDNNFSSGVVPGTRGDWRYTMYGGLISNSINITVSKHFYMELDVNGMVAFSDNRRRNTSFMNDDMALPILQFVLKTGVRF